MDTKQETARGKVINLGRTTDRRDTDRVVALIRAAIDRPKIPVPQAELALLERVALSDTGQSRSIRYLLFLLPGCEDPTGFKGEGLLELRPLDRTLADAFLKILDWWRGPTESDEPLYGALSRIEASFRRDSSNR